MNAKIIDVRAGFAHAQIVIGDVVTVVDPGNASAVLEALAREDIAPERVKRIVLTHGDGDHWGGADVLRARTGAEVVAHEAERGYLEGTAIPSFAPPKRALLMAARRWVRLPRVDRWLRGGEQLDDIEIVHAAGHTPGSICLVVGDALIAGDAFNTSDPFREVPRLMSADVARSRDSIRRLAGLDVTRAFSGHAPPADGAGAKLRALAGRLAS